MMVCDLFYLQLAVLGQLSLRGLAASSLEPAHSPAR